MFKVQMKHNILFYKSPLQHPPNLVFQLPHGRQQTASLLISSTVPWRCLVLAPTDIFTTCSRQRVTILITLGVIALGACGTALIQWHRVKIRGVMRLWRGIIFIKATKCSVLTRMDSKIVFLFLWQWEGLLTPRCIQFGLFDKEWVTRNWPI